MTDDLADFQTLHEQAYDAFDAGQLRESARLFAALIERDPTSPHYHYMQGLVQKYLRQWPESLHHNLRSLALREDFDESSHWNAGIAATAMGDGAQARAQWTACGIVLPPGEGPIEADFGVVSVRLNPWGDGETLFARRIDVVRSQLLNVPLPESGYRGGDIVLHDGASTGRREYHGRLVPVFNVLARLEPSAHRTFVAFVSCQSSDAIRALENVRHPGVAAVEDWTESVEHLCLRCSHGTPHQHDKQSPSQSSGEWVCERSLGVSALQRADVDALLAEWVSGGPGRHVEEVASPEHAPPEPEDGQVWWRSPDEDDEEDTEPG